jgi:sulfur carrier protein ThiS
MKSRFLLQPALPSIRASSATLAFFSSLMIAGATVIDFQISPAGTTSATGLSPDNEVPAVLTSTGSGDSISGGISFDTDTSTLTFAMGYGSAAGFTDLTGAVTGLHIHGPAATSANAPVIFNLASVHFPAANPAKGGLIFGSVVYSAPQAADLLAGLNYVNLHTAANSGGEIRGQLIRGNATPEIVCPPEATVECGESITYSAGVSDLDGDAVQVVWSVNGNIVQTDDVPAGGPPTDVLLTYTAKLPYGVNTLELTATDSEGAVTICESTITVEDTIAPVITRTSVNPKVLWPPNHKMVPVRVRALVEDACGDAGWEIVAVRSNQAVNGKGSGNTSPDWKITGDHTLLLRAERSGKEKSGRVYTIVIQATDMAGNKSDKTSVKVTVPHDQGGKDKKDKKEKKGKKGKKDKKPKK